jgi:hypothetical protein
MLSDGMGLPQFVEKEDLSRDGWGNAMTEADQGRQQRAEGMRARAQEVRGLAEGMQFAPARNTMLRLAATFDNLADHIQGMQQPETNTAASRR